ncbi:hypothetical protein shim_26530 [Shimia sp. SK013]|nr:hypothetical protein shim_26530 [Shimia sp. SK013]
MKTYSQNTCPETTTQMLQVQRCCAKATKKGQAKAYPNLEMLR